MINWTPEELAEMAAADAELDALPVTNEEAAEVDRRDRQVKLHRKDNKAFKLAETQRRYREANKEKLAETQRRYREANKEKLAETQRRYREANKEKIMARRKAHVKTVQEAEIPAQ